MPTRSYKAFYGFPEAKKFESYFYKQLIADATALKPYTVGCLSFQYIRLGNFLPVIVGGKACSNSNSLKIIKLFSLVLTTLLLALWLLYLGREEVISSKCIVRRAPRMI
ncbi:hypothetical protein SD10_14015 [Spirosoma radiotolerans]|uniref:Uncharacterized protein n=1 Tax=Spirosoma radiotolerans TaxID=1379870 RepID=A0A0E3ZWM4_9BACT|nr:hypothetical protein SD10_14015 [Spirosoma radiotolerans]